MEGSDPSKIIQVIQSQRGVVFASPAIVHRGMYTGRGIIAPNTEFSPDLVDHRGTLPVEWWIMSKTEAKNTVPIKNEGITSLICGEWLVDLPTALQLAGRELMGDYSTLWPLTKILDIGGTKRPPNFTAASGVAAPEGAEVPPIPCHVHAGEVKDGCCVGHGKTEAYFFPPLNVPPYNMELGAVKTRLGFKPGVTKEQVLSCLRQFGRTDDLYPLLTEYQIRPWESWTIEQKMIHAPGPWPTFEIQLPQDDFHLLAWVLGEKIASGELEEVRESYHLRGLESDEKLLSETLDWPGNTDPSFKAHWWRECEVLREGEWGRVMRLFYHIFYGEGFVVHPGCKVQREKDKRPFAGIVWSGKGKLNGLEVNCGEKLSQEFLVTPNHELELENMSDTHNLMVFTVFPLIKRDHTES